MTINLNNTKELTRYETKHVVNSAIAISQGEKIVFKELQVIWGIATELPDKHLLYLTSASTRHYTNYTVENYISH